MKTSPPFLDNETWKVGLVPGAYVVSLSLSWAGAAGEVSESGNVGLLVSRTHPLRVLLRPRCR